MIEAVSIQRRKLFELIADHIEGLILTGQLKPGEQLPPERELQTAFNVGRPAVREALITLERMGLIEIGNGVPARVTQPSAAGLLTSMVPSVRHLLSTSEGKRQFQAVRLLVEVGLVRQAAKEATPEFIAELQAALDENQKSENDTQAYITSDVAFHFAIARFVGEPAIIAIHGAMSKWLSEQREVSLREPGAAQHATEHHARIFSAIASNDPDAAEKAMRAHLEDVQENYWSHVDQA